VYITRRVRLNIIYTVYVRGRIRERQKLYCDAEHTDNVADSKFERLVTFVQDVCRRWEMCIIITMSRTYRRKTFGLDMCVVRTFDILSYSQPHTAIVRTAYGGRLVLQRLAAALATCA